MSSAQSSPDVGSHHIGADVGRPAVALAQLPVDSESTQLPVMCKLGTARVAQ